MFILVHLKDTIKIPPEDFSQELEAIKNQIHQKYSNKIIDNVGLCLEVYDIISIGESNIYQGDGRAFNVVEFRIIVFRPFIGEVITGIIKQSSREGLQISLGFFDQVWIPYGNLMQPAVFDNIDLLWAWSFQGHNLWLSIGNKIRLRILSFIFNSPEIQRKALDSIKVSETRLGQDNVKNEVHDDNTNSQGAKVSDDNQYPMILFGSTAENGLGPTIWWEKIADTKDSTEIIEDEFIEDLQEAPRTLETSQEFYEQEDDLIDTEPTNDDGMENLDD